MSVPTRTSLLAPLRRRPLATLAAGAAAFLLVGGASAWVRNGSYDADLLRSDPDAAAASPVLLRRARALSAPAYRTHCAGCHGAEMRGDPARGAPNLVDADWLYGSGRAAEIEQTLLYGVRSGAAKARNFAVMPAFGRPNPASAAYAVPPLSPGQLDDVAQYVLKLEGRAAERPAAERGRAVFGGTGGCYDCHAGDGGGDPAIGAPRLNDGVFMRGNGSGEDIRRILKDGAAGVCPAWSGRLPPEVIRALAVTIHAAAPARAP